MRWTALIIAVFVALGTTQARATEKSPTDAIRNANTRLRELLAQKGGEHKITTELRGLFDIGDLAKRALVDHWDTMPAAKRTELVDTLREVVERNYISQLRSNLEYEIVYAGEEPQGDDILVKTVIKAQRGKRPMEIPVDYLLHKEPGGWRAYDVITDEVSLLKNYRAQFNKIINKEGVDGLVRRMKNKLQDNGAE